jgi:uncharacterized protein YpmB
MKIISQIMMCIFFTTLVSTVIAQKLPNIQQANIYAPAHLKIDGIANEWNNQFQAYNKTVDIYYSIANDDSNLYLIVRAKNEDIIEKISKGGITLTIGKKSENNVAITFPMYDEKR